MYNIFTTLLKKLKETNEYDGKWSLSKEEYLDGECIEWSLCYNYYTFKDQSYYTVFTFDPRKNYLCVNISGLTEEIELNSLQRNELILLLDLLHTHRNKLFKDFLVKSVNEL